MAKLWLKDTLTVIDIEINDDGTATLTLADGNGDHLYVPVPCDQVQPPESAAPYTPEGWTSL